ncbi:MAG: trimethylamine methyltransferase family protein [Candidatus Bathyarchaeota archaeon]|nr:MAG: trimethylamine methyltransferase family protein [Candidatus Bathyarchaeota archaeon]
MLHIFTQLGQEEVKNIGKMRLQILSRNDLDRIHAASIKVLETIGAQFFNTKALNYLEKYGCTIDRKDMTATFPEAVVNEFMKKALPEYPYYNRSLKKIPKRQVYLQTFGQGTFITDRNGAARPSTLKDVELVSIVGNALDSVDRPTTGVTARDIHPDTSNLHAAVVNCNCLTNPKKTMRIRGNDRETQKIAIELGATLADGIERLRKTPIVAGGVCPTSPLVWPGPGLDTSARAGRCRKWIKQ